MGRASAARALARSLCAALLTVSAAVVAVPAGAGTTPIDDAGVVRVGGADRYETAVELSRRSFTAPVDTVFVATGTHFADALAGGPAAGSTGPVLLVTHDSIPDGVLDELARLQPGTIRVLGGESAVSADVAAALEAHGQVERLAGTDRYGTAAAVAAASWPSASTVYLATGENFADALAGGAAAVRDHAPILLTESGRLPDTTAAELERLAPNEVRILGGTAAVGAAVEESVRALLPSAAVTRLAGADRYATAATIAASVWPSGSSRVLIATGTGFADALAAVPTAAVNDTAPLLLSRGDCAPEPLLEELGRLGTTTRILVGGPAALADGVLNLSCTDLARPPFFVYGSLRHGESGYYLLDGRTVKEIPTRMPGLDLYRLTTSSYPYAVPNAANLTGIVGEAMSIAESDYSSVMTSLDRYERYDPALPPDNQTYVRELRTTQAGVPSWVYVAGPRQAAYLRSTGILITSGDWLRW